MIVDDILEGKYYLKEVKAKNGYILDNKLIEINIKYQENIDYYLTLSAGDFVSLYQEMERDLSRYSSLLIILRDDDKEFFKKQESIYNNYIRSLSNLASSYGLLQGREEAEEHTEKKSQASSSDTTPQGAQ